MASMLLGSSLGASCVATGGSCRRSEKCAKNYHAISYVTTDSWHKIGKIQKPYCIIRSSQHNSKHHYKGIEGGSTCQDYKKAYLVNATFGRSFESEPRSHDPKSIWSSVKDAMDVFYSFTRPYAILGTVLAVISASFLAVEKLSDISPAFFIGVVQAVVAAFCINVYICGINQLCDVEIDKINKPYLPLVSGEYSFTTGVIIVTSFTILAFGLALILGSWPLFWGVFSGFVQSTAYSSNLPLLRWKRFPLLTVLSNLVGWIISLQLANFFHIQTYVFKRPATFPRPLIFSIGMISIFCIVVSIAKDLPDTEGDKMFGIQSLPVLLGGKRVFWFCVSLVEMAYGVAILVGATSPFLWSKIIMGMGHAILALVLWYCAKSVDLKSKDALQSFYMFIWKLLYVELALIPLYR